jgi:thioredoxin reductase (NADPH)/alkyl hydroperoxide reductase subunit F
MGRGFDADLVIVGGGPAGCAAAVMAASLGARSVLVEAERLCARIEAIASLGNVLGGVTNGPDLAAAIRADVRRARACETLLGRRAVHIGADVDRARVVLDTGITLTADAVVVATGVAPLDPGDVDWITCAPDLALRPLWEADLTALAGRRALVLGGDRPLGTLLRGRPDADARFDVVHPDADVYKTQEVRGDHRVALHRVVHVTVREEAGGEVRARARGADRVSRTLTAAVAYLNIGVKPNAPRGTLMRDPTGYCPPEAQSPRVLVAGDLRGPRYQRIMTAYGSGAEAVLRWYYERVGA